MALLLPDDGFSCDVVKGVPHGLVDFLQPLQSAGLCRLAVQPTSIGHWTVYMHHYHVSNFICYYYICKINLNVPIVMPKPEIFVVFGMDRNILEL